MTKIKTADKILIGATKMFAQHGYDGTIMDGVAKQCDVNKASIYYHHKDKATLYENVLTTLLNPIVDTVIKAVEAESDPVKKLHVHIKTFANSSARNPDFASILMREMASGGVSMPSRAREQMLRILFQLNLTLQLGEEQGIFKPSNPLIVHFMIIGTINLFIASIPFRNTPPKIDACNQLHNTNIDAASEQVCETIISSLLIH
ncbi:MAG: TetR/AcrR family transcriptional regulator [Gammaproteobacteria bacterium]|nr:TetR/AcrR family transcriptional regulator [Gammaproteobacteria bacterium]